MVILSTSPPDILAALEDIDDDLDEHDVMLVKSADSDHAAEGFGVRRLPSLVAFRRGVPTQGGPFQGDMTDGEAVLQWVMEEVRGAQADAEVGRSSVDAEMMHLPKQNIVSVVNPSNYLPMGSINEEP